MRRGSPLKSEGASSMRYHEAAQTTAVEAEAAAAAVGDEHC